MLTALLFPVSLSISKSSEVTWQMISLVGRLWNGSEQKKNDLVLGCVEHKAPHSSVLFEPCVHAFVPVWRLKAAFN